MPANIVEGNLWDAKADVIGVTTNAYVNQQGRLVMGRGAAKEAAERYPDLPKIAAMVLGDFKCSWGPAARVKNPEPYGWRALYVPQSNKIARLGIFQVKWHFQDSASLKLILHSARLLFRWVNATDRTVAINYPGIGAGWLKREEVEPILHEHLSDPRITVYWRDDSKHTTR